MKDRVVVVGLGAMGSAVLYQLARRGIPAIGIDRFSPPHEMGSTHGESRVTRVAVGEGPEYVPLARRSHEIWRILEAEEGVKLFERNGCLIVAPRVGAGLHHGKGNFIQRSAEMAERFNIPHELLDAEGIRRRFPQFIPDGGEIAYFEPGGGMLSPERCVAAQLSAARRHGAQIILDEPVLDITQRDGIVQIRTGKEVLTAGRCVVTAGPWIGGLLSDLRERIVICRQTQHWFEADDSRAYAPERFPVFIWMHGPAQEDLLYGFPEVTPGAGIKAGSELYSDIFDPDSANREVSEAETAEVYRDHVAGRLHGVTPRRLRATACLYTVTPDREFLIDSPPGLDRVLAISACSGHGFKHSAGLGEAVAELVAEGSSAIDLAMFRGRKPQT